MTTKTIENIWTTIFVIIVVFLISVLIYLICGIIKQPKDVLVKQDTEYLYYKQYSIYGKDSTINKFHKPITFDGVVINKRQQFRGVPGKGGHWEFKINIKYNNDDEYTVTDRGYYMDHKNGDIVKVYVEYYPYRTVKILN